MIKKTMALAVMGLWFSVGAEAADLKIGVVNLARLLEKSPQAEKVKKDMEREFAPREKKLLAEYKDIKQMDERLAKDAAVMSDSERQRLEKDLMGRKREAKRLQDEYREDLNLKRNEELTKLQKEIFEAIQTLAKDEQFDLLLTEGVVYASESIDVTGKVEKKLESSFKR